MATLVTCQSISKHYGSRDLFRELSISFADREHIGFLGPNGAGKSTFLKILAGLVEQDEGEIGRRRGLRTSYLPQEDVFDDGATVEGALQAGLADEPLEPHDRDTRIAIILSQFGFEQPERPVAELSGGWRKRLALARALVREPDLLLLDEPTNHLDLEGIEWLEELLRESTCAFLCVSHDRTFLERVTDRVVELNPLYPGGFFSVSGDYAKFLEKRDEFLASQQAREASLAGIVRRETAFLQSNAKAQRTKSKWRTEEAYRLTDELREMQQRNGQNMNAGIDFEGTGRRSNKLLETKAVSKSLGGRTLFRDVSLFLSPGTRVGLLGPNGSGKTTLIRVLTGEIAPDEGVVQTADRARIVVFDQKREELPREWLLRKALAGTRDHVEFGGRSIHVSAWASRFLFRPDQLQMTVGELSGGEQSRILIARLMLRPADVLILDEPTNDLDIASLEALEESLLEFPGAVVLVTHDRTMLDRVCTEILGLLPGGETGRYGSCHQWQKALRERERNPAVQRAAARTEKTETRPEARGLSSKEKKELVGMEAAIAAADERVGKCASACEDPSVAADHVELSKRWAALEKARQESARLYARWEELESKT